MLVLYFIANKKYSVLIALFLIFALLSLRYVVPTALKYLNFTGEWPLFVLGVDSVKGVSYWFTPWLIYPLIGFILGVIIKPYRSFIFQSVLLPLSLFFMALLTAFVSYFLLTKGLIIFRWSVVSPNFILASVSCILFLLSLVVFFYRFDFMKSANHYLSMRGVSSLAVVPIHYSFINLYNHFYGMEMEASVYFVVFLVFFVTCLFLAKKVDLIAKQLVVGDVFRLKWFCYLIVATLFMFKVYYDGQPLTLLASYVAQLFLCVLLICPSGKRAS